jgi:D-sorbitol dehydrogenase (acceptor)
MPSDKGLGGQVALVTGAGKGIGRAIACALASAGARVVVADIQLDTAQQTAAAIGEAALPYQVDVSSADSQDRMFERIAAEYDRLDILVNNAGIFHVAPFLDFPLEAWRRVFSVNVDGALLATQRAARLMQKQSPHAETGCRGKIINISSGAAERGRPFLAAYGASKAALNHVSKTSSLVLAEHAICVTVVNPTSVREGMFGPIADEMASFEGLTPPEFEAQRAAGSPLGRLQKPEEVGSIAVWVAAARGMDLNGRLVYTEAHVGQVP